MIAAGLKLVTDVVDLNARAPRSVLIPTTRDTLIIPYTKTTWLRGRLSSQKQEAGKKANTE